MDALHFDYNQTKGSFDWNLVTKDFSTSHRLNRMLGIHPHDKISYDDFLHSIHPEDKRALEQSIKDNYPNEFLKVEARFLHPDRSCKWLKIYGKITYEKATPVHIHASIQDITEIKALFTELKESEQKFHLLADAMPQQVWTSGASGKFNYFNKAVHDFTGLDAQQIKAGGWSRLLHPEDLEDICSKWNESVSSGNDFIAEHRLRNFLGEYRWHQSRAIPQKDSNGSIQMWFGCTTDIHGQKNLVRELEKKIQRRTRSLIEENVNLTKTNNELQQFAYMASHDLQEPLRKIITFSNRIQQKYQEDMPEGSKAYLDKIISSSQRMTRLIEDLLNFSVIAGSDDEFSDTDLNDTLEMVLVDLEELIKSKHAEINYDSLPVVKANPVQMTQLFQNLIGNSLKFSRENVRPAISIHTTKLSPEEIGKHRELIPDKSYIELVIRDNGIGFNQEYADKVFNIFQRLNHDHKYKGSGIGLALCKKIAENHHGKISVESIKDQGTAFYIILPVS